MNLANTRPLLKRSRFILCLFDPAGRVLRAVRIAARTNFELSKETEEALAKVGRSALLSLDKVRVWCFLFWVTLQ
jgi:hypothetical protein